MFGRHNIAAGPLMGSFLGGGYRHQSKMFTHLDADLALVYGNSYWIADAMLGYTVPRMEKGAGG